MSKATETHAFFSTRNTGHPTAVTGIVAAGVLAASKRQLDHGDAQSLSDMEQGALMAVSILVALHDQPGIAADVVNELGLASADCSQLDDYDKQNLMQIQGERGIRLRGL
jgi:hypothetical protein